MAKQKLKITEEPFEFNFTVLAIASQSRDYHFCWLINRELGINLKRNTDLQVDDAKKRLVSYFSFYTYKDEDELRHYYFLANKSGSDLFLPEVKVADFLLVVNEKQGPEIKKMVSAIKKLPQVLAVTELQVNKLKSKKNLIFE